MKVLNEEPLSELVESKIVRLPLNKDSVNVVIAGDSRAERSLIPGIIKLKTGYTSINIAVNNGDLISFAYAVKKHYCNVSNIVFVISASSFHINDGAIDPYYLSLKCFQKMTIKEKIKIYKGDIVELLRMEQSLIKHGIWHLCKYRADGAGSDYDEDVIKESGYRGITGTLQSKDFKYNQKFENHPWYKKIDIDGARWRIFRDAFDMLGKMNNLFIIYQPPVSPIWKKIIRNSYVEDTEKKYSDKLKLLSEKYNNIVFYDFYTNDIKELDNSMYYDYQHLNRTGAAVFSGILSDIIVIETAQRMNKNGNSK